MDKRTCDSIRKFVESKNFDYMQHKNHFKSSWYWDDDWDGKIVRMSYALGKVGLVVSRIYRKGKVLLRYPNAMGNNRDRRAIIEAVCDAIGNDWREITFNDNGIYLHFDMGKPIKRFMWGY